MTRVEMCGVFIFERVVEGHFPATTLSNINTPHISTLVILHSPAYEDGTDRGFRNVGFYNSDAGELPKRKCTTLLFLSECKK